MVARSRNRWAGAALSVLVAAVVGMGLITSPAARGAQDELVRLGGEDRFATAVEVSRHRFPDGASTVYAAQADVSPDALVGSFPDGPTLLVPSCGTVPPVVIDEIVRLDPENVIVIGGDVAVSDGVAHQLQARASHSDEPCGPAPADPAFGDADLLLLTREDTDGIEITGQVTNESNRAVTITPGYEIEQLTPDGQWELILPHEFPEDEAERVEPGGVSAPQVFVPYHEEGEPYQRFLDEGRYRFTVNVIPEGATGPEATISIRSGVIDIG